MVARLIQYQLIDSKFEPYDPNYSQVFQEVKNLILKVIPELVIEHIGSTAIPGMSGKKIIDILIPCSKSKFSEILNKLEEIGFQKSPFLSVPEERPMKVAGIVFKDKFYNVHAHLTSQNSDVHLDNIYFRSQLSQNLQLARKYQQIKQEAVNSGKVEATEYNLAKNYFIQDVIKGRKDSILEK